jgi:C-terminal processing protease CtpA/Prc
MVRLNDTPDDRTIRPGMEIVEINGHKAADLLDRFLPMAPADGDIETGKRRGIGRWFARYYWWLVEQPDDFTVKATDAEGKTVTVKLAGVTDEERTKNQNPVNATIKAGMEKLTGGSRENLSLRFPKDPKIAEIRVRYFVGNDFRKWVEDTFKTLREKETKTLVIDLRGNGGGDDMYGALLVSYLADKPFRYFDHIAVKTITPSFKEHTDLKVDAKGFERFREGSTPNPEGGYLLTPKMHPGLAEQQPGKYPFLGKVFVLIDGGTVSTASDFCAVVHHLKRATFVGEETGGGYYGNNSGMMPTLTLPNSKAKVRLPLYEYWNAVEGYDGKRRGTRPDHVVELKMADLLRGVDARLDQAMSLAADSVPAK